MKLADLKAGMRNINTEGIVLGKSEPRYVNLKAGGTTSVSDITLGDDTGEITLSLWGGAIDKVRVGDRVKIENGYINTFKGVNSLSIGKFGKLSVNPS